MTFIEISLAGAATKDQVLDRIGEALQLGGPEGNVPAGTIGGKGWGRNWDALSDSLTELENGGIWGTSRRFEFPLTLKITESDSFRIRSPEGFATLKVILEGAKEYYAQNGMEFQFELQ